MMVVKRVVELARRGYIGAGVGVYGAGVRVKVPFKRPVAKTLAASLL